MVFLNLDNNTEIFSGNFFYNLISSDWILDSEVLYYICVGFNRFVHIKDSEFREFISIVSGQSFGVEKIGTVVIDDEIKLTDVFYISEFIYNFILIRKLVKDLNCMVIYILNMCIIQDFIQRKLIGVSE